MIFRFLYRHIALLIACTLPLVLAIVLALMVDGLSEDGLSAIVMGALSYMGSITLGVFVYYHSWLLSERQKEENRPRLWVKVQTLYKGEYTLTPEKALNKKGKSDRWYLPVIIKNLSNRYYSHFSIEYLIQEINGETVAKGDKYTIKIPDNEPTIAFGESMTYAVACDKRIITNDRVKWNECTFVISFCDERGAKYYLYHKIAIGRGYGVVEDEIYTETEFKPIRKRLQKIAGGGRLIQLQ